MEITKSDGVLVNVPGIYDMPVNRYHADPAPVPSLSASLIKKLLTETPRHAWACHPRLNPDCEESASRKMDFGTCIHELATRRGRGIVAIDAANYLTKAAKQARDEARAAGKTPILASERVKAAAILKELRRKIRSHPDTRGAFREGVGEMALIWQDITGIWGRALADWMGPRPEDLWDLKTTAAGLSDESIARKVDGEGLDITAAWYERALIHLRPELAGRVRYRFVFIETDEPFDCRVVELPEADVEIGRRKVAAGIKLWQRCNATGIWPGYPAGIERIGAPAWSQSRWLEREMAEAELVDSGVDPFLRLTPWKPTKQRKTPAAIASGEELQ